MKLLLFILIVFSVQAHAREFTVVAEITPPYAYLKNNSIVGIYKDILDYAFKDSKHTYVLNIVNTRTLITAIRSKEFDAIIGVSTYALHFSSFEATSLIGSISINPITINNFQLPLPYSLSLSSKRVGAVYGVGFENLLPKNINLTTFQYAQQGVVKLFNNEVDVIVENPLIIKCTSNTILGLFPSNKALFLHLPLIHSLDIYIGAFERNHPIINLVEKGAKTVNINSLRESYSKRCNETSNLILNK